MSSSRAGADPDPRSNPELTARVLWVTGFRTVAATLALVIGGIRLLSQRPQTILSSDQSLLPLSIVVMYSVVIVQAVLLRRRGATPRVATVHVGVDVLLATGLIWLTGGAESPFAFTYLLAVLGAAAVLGSRGALLTALASSICFIALSIAMNEGVLRPSSPLVRLSEGRLIFICVSNVLGLFLVAALAGFLGRQLSATGGRLIERERDLRALSRFHQQILESMPSGLITCDPAGLITFANRAAIQILGARELLEGRPIEELIPGVRALANAPGRAEVSLGSSRGERTLGLSVSSLSTQPGALLMVFQDLTALRRAEKELRRLDRLAELGALSARLAHEIRNPLAAMRGSAQLLEPGSDPESRRLLEILVREADRLSDLVNGFLSFSRPPLPELKVCSLDALVAHVRDILSTDPLSAGVEFELVPGGLEARVDVDQMKQVFLNLFRNGLRAAGPGGRIRVWFTSNAGGLQVHVWDSGGSISSADLPRVFEPFFSRSPGGTGLGLSTAQSIVRAHGGLIQVQSSPDNGTEFVVALSA
jgi:two-component system, NtrC family, sensor histidine kinase PilS